MKTFSAFLLLAICSCFSFYACHQTKKPVALVNKNEATDTSSKTSAEFTIAFGSCNLQNEPQPLWESIGEENPDLWIWLGDAIYADSKNVKAIKRNYAEQLANEDYAKFASTIPIIGIWDDNDYGVNNGDETYAFKSESRDLALNFYGVSKDAAVWQREGLYQSYVYPFEGLTIRVVLLDTRYFKDPIERDKKGYILDESNDMLGEAQWSWLEEELAKEEDILIIGNGTQVIPEEHRFEKWANYPSSRNRLFDLLEKEDADKIVLLSGDRHIGEMSRIELGEKTVYEITSSGMTHSYEEVGDEANKHRVGNLTGQLNYGLIKVNETGKLDLLLVGEDRERRSEVQY